MCTGITLATKNRDTFVRARTMEFAIPPMSQIVCIPKGSERVGTTPDGRQGKKWVAKHASVGADVLGMPIIIDGVNEAGLSIGLFYFSGKYGSGDHGEGYMSYDNGTDAANVMAPWELGSWILDTCSSLEEVQHGLKDILIPAVPFSQAQFTDLGKKLINALPKDMQETSPPVHYIVTDDKGESIVIEYFDQKLHIFPAPLGVITNTPSYDWHMKNLSSYISLSLASVEPQQLKQIADGKDYDTGTFGQGTGLFGIPGDSSPASRFVRAVAATQALYLGEDAGSYTPTDGRSAVLHAFHILNSFDIPSGSARGKKNKSVSDYTLWTSAVNITERKYYFRTHENSRIHVIDLKDYAGRTEGYRGTMEGREEFVELELTEKLKLQTEPELQAQ